MIVEIKIVDTVEQFDEVLPLLLANWAETGTSMEFKPEDARRFYGHLAQVGKLRTVLAYSGEALVGYATITVVPYPLNHSYLVCNVDGVYVLPDHRRGRVFAKIMEAVEFIAYEDKANAIQWHASHGSALEPVLAARYTPLSRYFRKELSYE